MHNSKLLTVIIPVIRPDMLDRCLETLYKYTDPYMFYTYVIDQTVRGLDSTALRNKYKNLMVIRTPKSDVHYTGNLGFAQATNLGISLVQTPYFMMCNDDIEFISSRWWQGVTDTFEMVEKATPERPAVIVNPSSFKLPDWSVGRDKGDDFYIIPYKTEYTDEEYDFLVNKPHYINEHLTLQPGSVIDGVTMYASVCHTQRFLEIGMLDERFFPGSGEDYDYSCRAAMVGYRSVGTTLSYVFHHWSTSFKAIQDEDDVKSLMIPEIAWNQTNEKWGDGFDIWGVKCPVYVEESHWVDYHGNIVPEDSPKKHLLKTSEGMCNTNMRCGADKTKATCPKHPDQIYEMPESTITPL